MTGRKAVVTTEKKDSGSSLVIQWVTRESGGSWPMLNHANYADWALLMQVMLEAHQLWVAINDGTPEHETGCTAMECLQQSVRPVMLSMLDVKGIAKEA
jgi:hypothetical protein